MSKTTIKPVSGTSSTKKSFTKFTPYNPSDYETYLSKLSSTEQKDFEQRVLFEKVWDENFDQEKFYTEEGSLKSKCGIYCIMNMIDRKKYFGESFRLNVRPYEHFNTLNKNKHYNTHLQNSYKKHGKENFIIFIVEFSDFNVLKKNECKNIEFFGDLDDRFLYNLKKDDDDTIVYTKETLLKNNKAKLTYYYLVQTPNGEIIKVEYFSQFCVDNFIKIVSLKSTDLLSTSNRKYLDTKGYFILFKYKRTSDIDYFTDYHINILQKQREEIVLKMNLKLFTFNVVVIDRYNNLYTMNKYAEFQKEHSIYNLNLTLDKQIGDKLYHAGGFKVLKKFDRDYIFNEVIFREQYSSEIKEFLDFKDCNFISVKYKVITPELDIIIVYDLYEYCQQNNIEYKNIYDTLSGKSYQHSGYKVIEKVKYKENFTILSSGYVQYYKTKLDSINKMLLTKKNYVPSNTR